MKERALKIKGRKRKKKGEGKKKEKFRKRKNYTLDGREKNGRRKQKNGE